jgi:hypothetical protein
MNPYSLNPAGNAIQQSLPDKMFAINRGLLIPDLAVGEIARADVLEICGGKSFLISLKNTTLLARSEAVLHTGDRINVKVERLFPQVILSLLVSDRKEITMQEDYLRWHRFNPEALKNMFAQITEKFSPESMGRLGRYLVKEDISHILRLTESLLFSGERSCKGMFLLDYIQNLGLLQESTLKAKLKNPKTSRVTGTTTLKGLLLKISADLRNVGEERTMSETEKAGIDGLLEFVETSIKAIEAHQIINVLCQEKGNGFMFQIPLVFPEAVQTGEIFILQDQRNAAYKNAKDSFDVRMLLDMDALGRIVVEARMKDNRINCLIRCERENVKIFMQSALDELTGTVEALGCRFDSVGCLSEALLVERIDAFYREHLFQDDAVNLFA